MGPVRGRYRPVRGAVPIVYCIVIVCERVRAAWITYFGVEIYIFVQQYIFQSSSTYFRAVLHISEEAVCTRREHGEDTVRTTS